MRHVLRSTLLALVFLFAALPACARPAPEQARIDYLINAIATLPDAKFLRNGSAYDAHAAADHLRTKLRAAGERVQTAEDFIVGCATASSRSGKKYQIRFGDGRVVDSDAFLRERLARYPGAASGS